MKSCSLFPKLPGTALALALLTVLAGSPAPLHAQQTVGNRLLPGKAKFSPVVVTLGETKKNIRLGDKYVLEGLTGDVVVFNTRVGAIYVQMLVSDAPKHVANFLKYVDAGSYTNTFFDRAVTITTGYTTPTIFQGGDYTINSEATEIKAIFKNDPVVNEYKIDNVAGTLASARTSDPNSATSGWYFNVRNNSTALGKDNGGGYTVFGYAIGDRSFGVLNYLRDEVPVPYTGAASPFDTAPLIDYLEGTSPKISQLVNVYSIERVPFFGEAAGVGGLVRFTTSSSNPTLVQPSVHGNKLVLEFPSEQTGTAKIRITAISKLGGPHLKRKFLVTVKEPSAQATGE